MSKINCEEARHWLPAYADRELDLDRVLSFETHLAVCADCSEALHIHRRLAEALRGLSYHRAPETLRARLHRQLPSPEVEAPGRQSGAVPAPREWRRWTAAIATGLVLALSLDVGLGWHRADQRLREELVAAQVRSLQAAHLQDVASSDQHTVKPWFAGRLDYAPPVRDFAAQGYPLLGGRLDYIAQRAVAALVYQRHRHTINLYVWPSQRPDALAPASQSRAGYSLLHWRDEGMEFWAVSDLGAQELQDFGRLQIEAAREPAVGAAER